jgi:hypothetical protein
VKLRFRKNSLRLRVNQSEVEKLASGTTLREEIWFPDACFSYELAASEAESSHASYQDGRMHVTAPRKELEDWARSDKIGLYFELPLTLAVLSIAIEKDLECLDGPEEERDPDAFPRRSPGAC